MKVVILGSGTSTGVPEVGCGCAACISNDPRDRRTRSSVLVISDEGKRILIDCGPDFREQAIRIGLDRVDAILLTHEHYDHIAGLDDLRTIAWQQEIPIYAEQRVLDALRVRMHYVFRDNPYPGTPKLGLHPIAADLPEMDVVGVSVQPIRVMHGSLPILGFRIGDLTYITDMKTMAETDWQLLGLSRLVVINVLRQSKPHPSHQSLDDLLEHYRGLVQRPEYTVLTHLSHHTPVHHILQGCLPDDISPAYDGMCIELSDTVSSYALPNPQRPWEYQDWGRIRYAEAWERQHELFDRILREKADGLPTDSYLVFCEHEPVFTLGKHGDKANVLLGEDFLLREGYDWFKVERGGDVTYHGPGQITGYPILDLERYGIGLRRYVELIEEAIIELLSMYQLVGERNPEATGVWLDADNPHLARKICAIGVRSSRYVTMHGFAFNVNTDLKPFMLINPCGFKGGKVTSLAQELGRELDFTVVKHQLSAILFKKFYAQLALRPLS